MRKYRGAKITSFTEGDRQLLRRGTVQCALLHNELMLQFESLQEDSVLCTGNRCTANCLREIHSEYYTPYVEGEIW